MHFFLILYILRFITPSMCKFSSTQRDIIDIDIGRLTFAKFIVWQICETRGVVVWNLTVREREATKRMPRVDRIGGPESRNSNLSSYLRIPS